MKSILKVAVIGVGHFGQNHARIYSELPQCELMAVVDKNLYQAKKTAKKFNCLYFEDIESVVDKIDAVSIATPSISHYEICKYFIQHNKHVLLEKPMTSNLDDAKDLIKLSKHHNIVFQVGHLERFNQAIIKVSTLINEPTFIETHRLTEFTSRSIDIDVILDLLIHDIDIILSFTKSRVKSIRASGFSILTDKVDIINAWLEFESGCKVKLTASRANFNSVRKIRIYQKENILALNYAAQKLYIYKTEQSKLKGKPALPKLVKLPIEIETKEPLKEELTSFINSIQAKITPVVTGDDGLSALQIAYDINKMLNI